MRSTKWKKQLITQALLTLFVGTTGKVYGDAPAPKWYDTIGMSGYVEGSYVGNLAAPQQGSLVAKPTNNDRIFDQETNSFNLNAFHLQIQKPVGDDGVGFTAKLHTGRDARIIKSVGTAGATDFDLEEAYLTYVPNVLGKKLTFNGGKFVTLEGVEVIEAPMNPNFSEGLLFGFAEPFTHTGVKANYAFTDKYNATVGVVNGWDTEADANDGKTVIWQLMTMPTKMVMWSFEGTYGPEALANNTSKRTSLDSVLSVNPTDKLSLWGQVNWGQDTNVVPVGGTTTGTTPWSGAGLWAQYAVNGWLTEALRFEVFRDQDGANRLGGIASTVMVPGAGPVPPAAAVAANQTMKEITWTNKFQLAKNMFTRLEFRHDWSNQGVFSGHVPGSTGKDQNTISADYYVTF